MKLADARPIVCLDVCKEREGMSRRRVMADTHSPAETVEVMEVTPSRRGEKHTLSRGNCGSDGSLPKVSSPPSCKTPACQEMERPRVCGADLNLESERSGPKTAEGKWTTERSPEGSLRSPSEQPTAAYLRYASVPNRGG